VTSFSCPPESLARPRDKLQILPRPPVPVPLLHPPPLVRPHLESERLPHAAVSHRTPRSGQIVINLPIERPSDNGVHLRHERQTPLLQLLVVVPETAQLCHTLGRLDLSGAEDIRLLIGFCSQSIVTPGGGIFEEAGLAPATKKEI
jgi:hypothetical protein